MAAKRPALHAVVPGEIPPPPKAPMTLTEAIEGGVYLEILRAQRRDIVVSLPEEKGPAKAALHRQLSILSKEIEALASQDSDEAEGGANVEDGAFDAEAI